MSRDAIEALQKDLNGINVWLQNVADIPPETKLVKDRTGFSIYRPTWTNWLIRTFLSDDSGDSHTNDFIAGYEKIERKVRECMNHGEIELAYFQQVAKLLHQSKAGLRNFMQHHKYRDNAHITSNIQNLCNFVIPRQVKLIRDYSSGEKYMIVMSENPSEENASSSNEHKFSPLMAPFMLKIPEEQSTVASLHS